jgi:nicotinamide-nucleotide adenylyltransferase
MRSNNLPVGSAHGRFQPLHLGHLEYLLAAKAYCDFLWIGITQFDVTSLAESPADLHRQDPFNNPLSYFERAEMITGVMLEAGLRYGTFGVLPFPIDRPASLANYLPTSIPVFTTICEPWNRYKIETLHRAGYTVVVLWDRKEKSYEGMHVRKNILAGKSEWRQLVPPATVRIVEKYRVPDRLREASKR